MRVLKKNKGKFTLDTLQILRQAEEVHLDLFNHLQSLERLNVLDIGCGVPFASFEAYHSFNLSSVELLDTHPEMICVKNFIKGKSVTESDLKNASTFFEIYSSDFKSSPFNKPRIDNKVEFDAFFLPYFHCNTIQSFLAGSSMKYELIFALNIFHLLGKEMESTLLGVSKLLSEKGILISRVQERKDLKNDLEFDYEVFKETFGKCFEDALIIEFYKDEEWHHSICMNRDLLNL